MNPTALRARLDSRGYIPVSHAPADHPEEWFDLDGKAGSIRVITCPGDGNPIEVLGLGPRPAGLALFGIRLSASTPEQLIIAVLNTAETWLTGDPAASPRLPSPQAAAPGPGSALPAATRGGLTAYLTASPRRHLAGLPGVAACGYHPLDTGDPVIDRALDELPGYPPKRQAGS